MYKEVLYATPSRLRVWMARPRFFVPKTRTRGEGEGGEKKSNKMECRRLE